MGTLTDDYDLLLTAPSAVEAALARDLLAEQGLPCFTHGRDRDLAELGSGVHNALTRPDVYVPKGLRERAQAILKEAWSDQALSESQPVEGEVPNADTSWSSSVDTGGARDTEGVAPGSESRFSWTPMVLGVIAVAVVFGLLWLFARP